MKKVVLASTSPYRAEVLKKLGLAFSVAAPNCDEKPIAGETHSDLVKRLALEKASSIRELHPDSLIIGSDQVAELDDQILGKPSSHSNAVEQLLASSGRCVTFHTGLCLYDSASQEYQVDAIPYHVHFRDLSELQIERYLQAEKPYNCAGSFKSEALGITLFERLEGDDPNALIGLPLIALCNMLATYGITLP